MKEGKKHIDPDKTFCVHPDALEFSRNYFPGQSFNEEIAKIRKRLEEQGIEPHNQDHDAEMLETARDNTDNAIVRGWQFPQIKK